MRKLPTRLSVDGLEPRLTPATADPMAAAAQTAAGWAFFNAIKDDPAWIFNPAARSFLQQKMHGFYAGAQGAMGVPGMEGAAQMIMGLSQQIGDMLGFAVFVPPPAPPALTDAEGMVFAMPSPTALQWSMQPSGLKIWDVVEGTGDPAVAGDSVTAFYTGWLAANGNEFDSARTPDAPTPFSLTSGAGGVIEGWVQGVPGMKPGGIRRLYIPAALAYGSTPRTGIPANSDLIFEIKLVSHT